MAMKERKNNIGIIISRAAGFREFTPEDLEINYKGGLV